MTDRDLHVVGHLGGRNFGDELMLAGVADAARSAAPGMRIETWSLSELPSFLRVLREAPPSTVLILAGSSFHDYYLGSRALRQTLAKATYVSLALAARIRGWRVLFSGSLGPSWRPMSRLLDRSMVKCSTQLLLRERRSLDYAALIGGSDRCSLVPDPALTRLANVQATGGVVRERNALICPVVDRQFAEWVYPVPDTIMQALQMQGFRTVRLLASHSSTSTDTDENALDELDAAATRWGLSAERISVEGGAGGVEEMLDLLVRHQLVIAARLHPAMAAMASGTPTVIAPYHPKLREVLTTWFEPVWTLRPHDTVSEAQATIRSALEEAANGIECSDEWSWARLSQLLGAS